MSFVTNDVLVDLMKSAVNGNRVKFVSLIIRPEKIEIRATRRVKFYR